MRMFNKPFKDDSLLSEVSAKIDSTKFCLGYRGRSRRMADSTQLLNVEKPTDATAESSLLLAWVRLQIATRDANRCCESVGRECSATLPDVPALVQRSVGQNMRRSFCKNS